MLIGGGMAYTFGESPKVSNRQIAGGKRPRSTWRSAFLADARRQKNLQSCCCRKDHVCRAGIQAGTRRPVSAMCPQRPTIKWDSISGRRDDLAVYTAENRPGPRTIVWNGTHGCFLRCRHLPRGTLELGESGGGSYYGGRGLTSIVGGGDFRGGRCISLV